MGLAHALRELDAQLATLDRALDNLRWAVEQGQPIDTPGHALLDHYERTTVDLAGLLRELRLALRAEPHISLQAFVGAQRSYTQLLGRVFSDLIAFEQFALLDELAHEEPALWGDWVVGVVDALAQCPPPIVALGAALASCQEYLLPTDGDPLRRNPAQLSIA